MILNIGDIFNLYDNEERLEIIEKVYWFNLCFIYCRKIVFICLRLIEMIVILSVCYGNFIMFVYILNDFKLDELYIFCLILDVVVGFVVEFLDGDDFI